MNVEWKVNLFRNASADACYKEICEIGESATPRQILEFARNPNTELHKCFEWDDSVAAEKYRLSQARMIVCNLVTVSHDKESGVILPVRLIQKADDAYKPVKLILRNAEEYERLLARAREELRSIKRRYNTISELEEIFAQID